jgi:AcrR family transcriptional regulator
LGSSTGRGRPPVIEESRLLEVAREVFLELGIRATTAEVARRAGISEGAVFRRYHSKACLFGRAMSFDPEAAPALLEGLRERLGQGDLRVTLTELAERLLQLGRIALPVMMMLWSNPEAETAGQTCERGERYQRAFGALRAFLAAEMELGRLQPNNPELLARVFMGTLHNYCMTELLSPTAQPRLPAPVLIQGLVDLLHSAKSVSGMEMKS